MFILKRSAAIRLLAGLAMTGGLVNATAAQPASKQVIDVARQDGGREVKLKPEIYWPAGPGPFGAVIIVNSSSGQGDIFLTIAPPRWLKEGVAAVVLDTFTPRGVASTVADQSRVTSTQMALDAYAVADALRKDARIKPDKIALQGQSKGAVTAMHAATQAFRQWSGAGLGRIDAAIATAPSCEFQFRDATLAAPLYAILGEKDDYTLPGPCIGYFQRMRAAKQPVAWEVIKGANHAWSTRGASRDPSLWTARKCADAPLFYANNGFESSKDGKFISFTEVYKHCEARGASVGGANDQRGKVLDLAVSWLKAKGW